MNKRSKTLLVVLASTLFIFASGCVSAQVSTQNHGADLIYIGQTPNKETLQQIVERKSLPVIIIGSRSYLPARECIGDRSLGGDSESRSLGGDSENRSLGGDSENRSLGGDSESRSLGGDSENRSLGGDSENRSLGGDSENRSLGGDSANRSLGGDSENRSLGGDSENRSLGGDSENRSLGGDSESRSLGGDSEDRSLGGASAKIKCARTANGFQVIYSSEKVTIFDGSRYIEKSSEYEF